MKYKKLDNYYTCKNNKKMFLIPKITKHISNKGCMLRMNRSIQAEGSFPQIKQDIRFRTYLSKGNDNVLSKRLLLAMAHNINKLHIKIQSNRKGTHLFVLKKKHNF